MAAGLDRLACRLLLLLALVLRHWPMTPGQRPQRCHQHQAEHQYRDQHQNQLRLLAAAPGLSPPWPQLLLWRPCWPL